MIWQDFRVPPVFNKLVSLHVFIVILLHFHLLCFYVFILKSRITPFNLPYSANKAATPCGESPAEVQQPNRRKGY